MLGLLSLSACDGAPIEAPWSTEETETEASDSGIADYFEPLEGLGEISGDCGLLDDEWSSSLPELFRNELDFGDTSFDEEALSEGGTKVFSDGNLGGSSIHSEVFAFEVLYRCELATLLKTETEILYVDSAGKKTDLLVEIDGHRVGVSVTRAYHYPPDEPYPQQEATELLEKKLGDIPLSAANAHPDDAWPRSLLHILAYDETSGDAVQAAWAELDAGLRGATLVWVTVTDGKDGFLY